MDRTLDQLIEETIAWQRVTFADGTEEGRIKHFLEEIEEYLADPSGGEEAADVFLLFVAIYANRGIDLRAEVERKLAINKARTWVKVPGGYSKHVAEPEVTPNIGWEDVPLTYKYAWLILDPAAKGFSWCVSARMPTKTPRGYNGSSVRMWDGKTGVQVREGVDFRTIFRQRPEGEIDGQQ